MKEKPAILIATTNEDSHSSIVSCFAAPSYSLSQASTREELLAKISQTRFEFAFIDLEMISIENGNAEPGDSIRKAFEDTEVIILCNPNSVSKAVGLVREGANSYLLHPVKPEEISYIVESTRESNRLREQLSCLRDEFWQKDTNYLVETKSPVMSKVIEAVRSVAPTNTTVLLTGETGTGKGVLAGLIHQHSPRKDMPFVSVHCGAIPENLIESELFGHEKGSFTGAVSRKTGKFELAKGGTIFLDEVGTMSMASQVKLLKVLQEKIFQRVGGNEDIEADARVIAAANRDLLRMCENNEFRSDLYYRISVFPIEIPPLSKRREDMPHIIQVLLKRLNAIYGKNIAGVRRSVLRGFERYSWPGNIRELENVIERGYILELTGLLSPQNFPPDIVPDEKETPVMAVDVSGSLAEVRQRAVRQIEESYIREKLAENSGRIDKTASAAGISSRQLNKLMAKYGIRKELFKN
jgi:DNA-binding NtrC family response regulator